MIVKNQTDENNEILIIKKEKFIFNTENENIVSNFKKNYELSDSDLIMTHIKIEKEEYLQIKLFLMINKKEDTQNINNNIRLEWNIEKKLEYFLNLHEYYILFKKDIDHILLKIKEKIKEGNFNVTLHLTSSLINRIDILFTNLINLNNNEETNKDSYLDLSPNLHLFFSLDNELITLTIPINIFSPKNDKQAILKNSSKEKKKDYLRLSENKIVRKADKNDIPLILSLIKELALFEKMLDAVSATERDLEKNLFGERAYAEVLIYEIEYIPVAFALFFHNFSTFMGKPGLYLEDIYVKSEFRNQGIGTDFFVILAKIAKEKNCGRFEWSVLNWNEKAIEFYKKMGAYPMSKWTVYRMDYDNIMKLAEK